MANSRSAPDETENAFVARIVAKPADALPRLVFADWLEERGRPADLYRAAAIRNQFPPGQSGELYDHRAVCAFRKYAVQVVRGIGLPTQKLMIEPTPGSYDWEARSQRRSGGSPVEPKVSWAGLYGGQWAINGLYCFRHGFVSGFATSLRRLRAHAATIFSSQPIEHVSIQEFSCEELDRSFCFALAQTGHTRGWNLPREFFDLLPGEPFEVCTSWSGGFRFAKSYPTKFEADESLNAALVRYGRIAAGLEESPPNGRTSRQVRGRAMARGFQGRLGRGRLTGAGSR